MHKPSRPIFVSRRPPSCHPLPERPPKPWLVGVVPWPQQHSSRSTHLFTVENLAGRGPLHRLRSAAHRQSHRPCWPGLGWAGLAWPGLFHTLHLLEPPAAFPRGQAGNGHRHDYGTLLLWQLRLASIYTHMSDVLRDTLRHDHLAWPAVVSAAFAACLLTSSPLVVHCAGSRRTALAS